MAVPVAAARLSRPGLDRLVDELHRRYGSGTPPASVRLRDLSQSEQVALADLFGSPRLVGSSAQLALHRLAKALGLDSTSELREVVERLRGPALDRSAARAAASAARDQVWADLREQARGLPAVVDPAGWVDRLQHRTGVRGGLDRHRRWLSQVLGVLAALPAEGLTLAELAQDTLGDPHGLDAGRSVAAAVLDALQPAHQRGAAGRRDAEATRALWESVGVAPDALSSTVLALGLGRGADASHPLASWWEVSARYGEPTVQTLASLRRWPVPSLAAHEVAVVVENPSLIAAAARTAWDGPVLVCSSGRPTVAVLTLLRQLRAKGATVYQHADFDPAGLAITCWLSERCGTVPWRMGTRNYREALAARAGRPDEEVDEVEVPATPWDPELGRALAEEGRWVFEEEVRAGLLARMRELSAAEPDQRIIASSLGGAMTSSS